MSLEAKDLLGLSQPAQKLIDAISSGLGILYEPTRIRRRATADADAQLILAHADLQKDELLRRAAQRLGYQETLRQRNIDAIVAEGFRSLPETASDTPVDPDWLSHFFESCQDISDVEMQRLWGTLLSGEVSQPGSFSRRTVSTLQQMGPAEAEALERALQLSWQCENIHFLLRIGPFNETYLPHNFSWFKAGHLSSFGLMNSDSTTVVHLSPDHDLIYHGRHHRVRPFYLFGSVRLPVFTFSSTAEELAQVIALTGDDKFYPTSRRLLARRMWLRVIRPRSQGQ